MKREEFLKRLGIGTAAAVISPLILAEAMKQDQPLSVSPIADNEPRVLIKKHSQQIGSISINGEKIMDVSSINLMMIRQLHDATRERRGGWKEHISGPAEIKAVVRGHEHKRSGMSLVDHIHKADMVDVDVQFNQVQSSFSGYIVAAEFINPATLDAIVEIEIAISGAITMDPQA